MGDNELSLCDSMALEARANDFRRSILSNLESITGGIVTVRGLVKSEGLLDIGCGRGALGKALRMLGHSGIMVGLDPSQYSGDTAYDAYNEFIPNDVRSGEALERLNHYSFDRIIAVGVPPQVTEFLAKNRGQLKLSLGGILCIVSDYPLRAEKYKDFSFFHGGVVTGDDYILVHERGLEDIAREASSRDRATQYADGFYNQILSKREIQLLRDRCQGQVLFDLGAGKNAQGVVRFASDKLGVSKYVAVDKYYHPDLGPYASQRERFESRKEDALLFLSRQPDNTANITVNALDEIILKTREEQASREYVEVLLREIARVTVGNGLVFGTNSPFLRGLSDLGFRYIEGSERGIVYGVWQKG